ncbi:MAG TPA: D-tyrosyl-tRNA(Tyr) deacylase [Clostridiales bacterium UBA8153]|nr:D-tyrosyl-tRNA(Tyr) deacylase [Clostridiales bacterium UBA8153]
MRAVVQRVIAGRVTVAGRTVGAIGPGLVVLLGVCRADTREHASYLADKVAHLRIFEDPDGRLNRSVLDVGGGVLSVSQFTLLGDCRRGRRPSFSEAALPEEAFRRYEEFNTALQGLGIVVAAGEFGARMVVTIENDGPVTILLDSAKQF